MDGWGDGALDASAVAVSTLPLVGLLLGPRLLEDFVFDAGPQGEIAAGLGVSAGGPQLAGPAVTGGEADPCDRGAPVALGRSPGDADLVAGAGSRVLVPVDGEAGVVEEVSRHLLANAGGRDRPHQFHPVIAPGMVDLFGVHEVLVRQQPSPGQSGVDVLQDNDTVDRCRGGVNVSDQVRGVGLARLAQVDLVAGPAEIPLGTCAGS